MAKFVVNNAELKCSCGTASSNLKVGGEHKWIIENQNTANISDHIPMKNICPFGNCTNPANPAVAAALGAPQPCVPVTPNKWSPGAKEFYIDKEQVLDDVSTCQCVYGGVISVADAGQGSWFIDNILPSGGTSGSASQAEEQQTIQQEKENSQPETAESKETKAEKSNSQSQTSAAKKTIEKSNSVTEAETAAAVTTGAVTVTTAAIDEIAHNSMNCTECIDLAVCYTNANRVAKGKEVGSDIEPRTINYDLKAPEPKVKERIIGVISSDNDKKAEKLEISVPKRTWPSDCPLKGARIIVNKPDGETDELNLGTGEKYSYPVPSSECNLLGNTFTWIDFLKKYLLIESEASNYNFMVKTCDETDTFAVVKAYPDASWKGGFDFEYKGGESNDKLKDVYKGDAPASDGWCITPPTLEIKRNSKTFMLEAQNADIFPGIQLFLSQVLPLLKLSNRYIKGEVNYPKFTVSGSGTLHESSNNSDIISNYNLGLDFNPLFGGELTVDIFTVVCDLTGHPYLVHLRDLANKGVDKFGVKARATVELILKVEGSLGGTFAYNTEKENDSKVKGEVKITATGKADGEVKAFIVQANIGIMCEAETAAGAELEAKLSEDKKPQVYGQLYFNGLIIKVMAYLNYAIDVNDSNGLPVKSKPKGKLGSFITKKNSKKTEYSINLLDKKKWPEEAKLLPLYLFNG